MASDVNGKPEKTRYIFDLLTKWFDLNRFLRPTSPTPRDVKGLETFYEQHKTAEDSYYPDVYQLAEFYIKKNPNSHFIFDEVPIIQKG